MSLVHTFRIIAGHMSLGDGHGSGGLPAIPAGVFIGRDSPELVATASDYDFDTIGGSSSATAQIEFRIYRKNISGSSGFEITISRTLGTGNAFWYNTANVQASLTATEVSLYTNTTAVPTEVGIKRNIDSAPVYTVTGSDGIYKNALLSVTASTSAGGGTQFVTESFNDTFEFWGRASGYADTLLGSFTGTVSASAESSCFIGESLVTMSDYTTKRIDDIVIGDIIIGQDGISNEVVNIRTVNINSTIYGFNGIKCFVTASHPFLTTTGWKSLNVTMGQAKYPDLNITQLAVGDTLIKFNADTQLYYEEEIVSIEQESLEGTVYNLNVSGNDTPDIDGNDTYIVNGYVVHNK
jgi:hypothetical protein